MSKSLGNIVAPSDLMKTHGADILRLWVVSDRLHRGHADRPGDPGRTGRHLSPAAQHLALPAGQPRRLHRGRAAAACARCPSSSAGCCTALAELDAQVRECNRELRLPQALRRQLHNFCAVDLSAFYFDIRKDALYCDPVDSVAPPRRAHGARPSCSRCLTAWLAPVARLHRRGGLADPATRRRTASVHLRTFPDVPGRLARRGAGRALGAGARAAPRRHRRPGARARREADRLQPAGGARVYLDDADRRRWRASTSPSSRSPAASSCSTAPPPAARSRCPTCRAWPSCPAPADGRQVRALLAGPARGRGSDGAALPALHGRRGSCSVRPNEPMRASAGPVLALLAVLVLDQADQGCWSLRALDAYQPLVGDPVLRPRAGLEPRRQLRHVRGRRRARPWLLMAWRRRSPRSCRLAVARDPAADPGGARGWSWPARSATPSTACATARSSTSSTSTCAASTGRPSTSPTAPSSIGAGLILLDSLVLSQARTKTKLGRGEQ